MSRRVETGGGWGQLDERPIEFVARDLERGYISEQSARDDYGVSLDADGTVQRDRA